MKRLCCQRIFKNLNDFFPKKCVLNEFTSLKKRRSSKVKTNFLSTTITILSTTITIAIKMLLHMIKRTIVFKSDRFESYVFYLRCYRNDQSVFQKRENDPSLIPSLWNYLNIIILCGTPRARRYSQGTNGIFKNDAIVTKKNEHIERVLKNIGTIFKRTNVKLTVIGWKEVTRYKSSRNDRNGCKVNLSVYL